LLDVSDRWREKTYEDLEEDDRQRLDDSIIHTTIFKQDQPEGDKSSIYEVFEVTAHPLAGIVRSG
jgi:hypothetical protein